MNWLFFAEGAGVVALAYVLYKRGTFSGGKGGGSKSTKIEEKVVAIGKGQISYLTAGNPKAISTVVLLHGFAADKEHWLDVIPLLAAEGYQVVAPDLPGFGANFPDPDGQFDATSLAKQVRTFAKHAGLVSFHLVGHSIGAIVAASYAYASPTDVASLTLIEPLGVSGPAESDFDRQLKNHRNPFLIAKAEQYDGLLAYTTVTLPAMTAARKRRRAEGLANNRPFYQLVWSKLLEGERARILDLILPELKRKTLVIFGAKSKVVPQATGKMLELRMPDARVGVIPDSGHWLMLEKPKELAEMLVAFYRGGGPPKSARKAAPAPDQE
ncbi:MAG TPA: alpha/beta fold hydrolase [Thermoanaerobaculia bacterium]|nr:alpha/beta fold hydrolase [Thermoanaerobaculia bacterium]HXT52600.1 alpha/beta fold hydrolase [Thermoanaerobaculia bacterium]